MMKNAFYFILKPHFIFKIFKFCSDFLIKQKNGLIRKPRLILKFMMSQAGHKVITIHILPIISRSKINQTMKLGQLTGHNMKNNFLEKSCTK